MAQYVDTSDWLPEEIPDAARLFMRVHARLLPDGELHPGIFREHEGSMSVDWEKYSTVEECRDRHSEPAMIGVVALNAGIVRSIEDLAVEHTPDLPMLNRSHTDVRGIGVGNDAQSKIRKTKIRYRLFQRFNSWEIRPKVLGGSEAQV